jgi:flagellar motor switch protein FliM
MGREAICDFPRSDAVTARDLRLLQTQHNNMASVLASAFSELLRSPVDATFSGVEQFAYGKFVHGLASPSHFSVLKAEPLGDCLMLDIELAILYPMLDRMLGGGHEDEPPPRRALSDVEIPLAVRVARVFLEQLRQTWHEVLPLKFETLQIDSEPRLLRTLPAEETVAIVGFTLTVGGRQGMIRLCIPCRAVRQLADALADGSVEDVDSSLAKIVVTLATSSITVGELRGLQVGDIIATEAAAGSAAIVSIDGHAKFRAKPGACDGCKAVVLSEEIGDSAS